MCRFLNLKKKTRIRTDGTRPVKRKRQGGRSLSLIQAVGGLYRGREATGRTHNNGVPEVSVSGLLLGGGAKDLGGVCWGHCAGGGRKGRMKSWEERPLPRASTPSPRSLKSLLYEKERPGTREEPPTRGGAATLTGIGQLLAWRCVSGGKGAKFQSKRKKHSMGLEKARCGRLSGEGGKKNHSLAVRSKDVTIFA